MPERVPACCYMLFAYHEVNHVCPYEHAQVMCSAPVCCVCAGCRSRPADPAPDAWQACWRLIFAVHALPELQQVTAWSRCMLRTVQHVLPTLTPAGYNKASVNVFRWHRPCSGRCGVDRHSWQRFRGCLPCGLRFTASCNLRYLLSCLQRKWHSCHWPSECTSSNSVPGIRA